MGWVEYRLSCAKKNENGCQGSQQQHIVPRQDTALTLVSHCPLRKQEIIFLFIAIHKKEGEPEGMG